MTRFLETKDLVILQAMATREQLRALIDQIPDEMLDLAHRSLESILNPAPRHARIEKLMERSQEFQKQLPERLKLLQAGANLSNVRGYGMSGALGSGPDGKGGDGEHAYTWNEERTRVKHRMMLYDGREMDITERFELTEDGSTLIYRQENYAGGRVAKREERFSIADSE